MDCQEVEGLLEGHLQESTFYQLEVSLVSPTTDTIQDIGTLDSLVMEMGSTALSFNHQLSKF